MEWDEQIHKNSVQIKRIQRPFLCSVARARSPETVWWCQWHVLDKWKKIFWIVFFLFRFFLEWATGEQKPKKKEKEKCVPAGILSKLENVNSMLHSETERAEDTTYAQAETEKPTKFPQEEGAHHSIPLIFLKRNKNCLVVIDLRNAAKVWLENVKDIEMPAISKRLNFRFRAQWNRRLTLRSRNFLKNMNNFNDNFSLNEIDGE